MKYNYFVVLNFFHNINMHTGSSTLQIFKKKKGKTLQSRLSPPNSSIIMLFSLFTWSALGGFVGLQQTGQLRMSNLAKAIRTEDAVDGWWHEERASQLLPCQSLMPNSLGEEAMHGEVRFLQGHYKAHKRSGVATVLSVSHLLSFEFARRNRGSISSAKEQVKWEFSTPLHISKAQNIRIPRKKDEVQVPFTYWGPRGKKERKNSITCQNSKHFGQHLMLHQ